MTPGVLVFVQSAENEPKLQTRLRHRVFLKAGIALNEEEEKLMKHQQGCLFMDSDIFPVCSCRFMFCFVAKYLTLLLSFLMNSIDVCFYTKRVFGTFLFYMSIILNKPNRRSFKPEKYFLLM